jgi:hypothetical protein
MAPAGQADVLPILSEREFAAGVRAVAVENGHFGASGFKDRN